MRTLSTSLLTAQKKADRLPYVDAKVYDYEAGIKRLSWTRLYEGSEADNHHGIAFDGQGSMHRIRAAADNKLYRQKITSPARLAIIPSGRRLPLTVPVPVPPLPVAPGFTSSTRPPAMSSGNIIPMTAARPGMTLSS